MSLVEEAAKIIAESKYLIAFTGAGISAESGIPTFRDPGGIWDQFDPTEVGTTGGFLGMISRNPGRIRDFLKQTMDTFEKADPNPGHKGLVELEKMGILKSVVTQNIDDLHGMAGNSRVFEVHGNLYRHRCMSCGRTEKSTRDELIAKTRAALEVEPFDIKTLAAEIFRKCTCGGMMRIDVVMFGEPVQEMAESYHEASQCDVVLILGTSGVVYPAAGVPVEARRKGAKAIEINPTTNAFQGITDVYIKAKSGEAMPQVVDMVRELR